MINRRNETDDYGRFDNSLSMNGARIVDHDVLVPAITGRQFRFEVDDSTGGNVGAVEIRAFAPLG